MWPSCSFAYPTTQVAGRVKGFLEKSRYLANSAYSVRWCHLAAPASRFNAPCRMCVSCVYSRYGFQRHQTSRRQSLEASETRSGCGGYLRCRQISIPKWNRVMPVIPRSGTFTGSHLASERLCGVVGIKLEVVGPYSNGATTGCLLRVPAGSYLSKGFSLE